MVKLCWVVRWLMIHDSWHLPIYSFTYKNIYNLLKRAEFLYDTILINETCILAPSFLHWRVGNWGEGNFVATFYNKKNKLTGPSITSKQIYTGSCPIVVHNWYWFLSKCGLRWTFPFWKTTRNPVIQSASKLIGHYVSRLCA